MRKTSPSLRSITLVRVVPAAVVLLGCVSVLVVQKVNTEFSNQIQEQVDNRAEGIQLAIRTKLRQSLDACSAIANNDIIINSIVDLEHRKSSLQPFIQSLDFPGTPVHNIAMLGYNGEPIAQQLHEDPRLEELKSWLRQSDVTDTFVRLTADELIVAQPVYYGSAVEGGLVAIYDAGKFFEDVVAGGQDFSVQIAFAGKLLAYSDNIPMSSEGTTSKPSDWLSSKFAIPELPGLYAEVWQSNQTAAEAARAVRNWLAFAVVGISGVLLLGLLVIVGFATRQLNGLIEAIKGVRSKADLSRRVSTSEIAEFQELQKQFNGMLSELERTTVSREAYRIPALVARFTDNLVVVTDASGKIEWVNEAFTRRSGFDLSEVIGESPGSILQGPKSDAKTVQEMRDSVSRKEGFDVEVVNYSKSGEAYWVSIESRPIYDEAGEVINFIAIESDITLRRKAELEKEEMAREMITLSRQAGMAEVAIGVLHNIGNVLNSINVSTTLMLSAWRDSKVNTVDRVALLLQQHQDDLGEFMTDGRGKTLPELMKTLGATLQAEQELHREQLVGISKSVEHIKEVVRGQQENATAVSANEATSPVELVEEAIRFNQNTLEETGVEIRREFEEVPDVYTDRHKVLQILVNLIANAKNAIVEYRFEDRQIEVGIAEEASGSICITISDNGVGIAPENITRIFGHGFTTRKRGHGFGLHSSALAAEAVGGALTVQSDGMGCGAVFTLRLSPCESSRLAAANLASRQS
ncbi:MAG: ATP-binding protein [Pirellulaceae bacterium]